MALWQEKGLECTSRTLTAPKMKAMLSLEKSNKLIIKPSDKGGSVVLLNSLDYRQMCLSILQDPNCYEILSHNPSNIYMTELKSILDETLSNLIISKQEYKYLLPSSRVTSTFYR